MKKSIFLAIIISLSFLHNVYCQSVQEIIEGMLKNGFKKEQSLKLYGRWKDVKDIMVQFADCPGPKQDLAKEIVEYRFQALEDTWREAVGNAAKRGIQRPVEAMVPTGGWKAPLALKDKNVVEFIKKGSGADIDATLFGRPGAVEDVTRDTLIKWAQKTASEQVIDASGKVNYRVVNQVIRESEVAVFPRDFEGRLSEGFQRDFPEIVHEAYPGGYGQRSLDVLYLSDARKAPKADFVRYDKNGNIVMKDGKVQISRDQPAINAHENLTQARYTRLDRLKKSMADYELKFKGHLTGNVREDATNTAKMMQRMIEEESRIKGYSPSQHPLYEKSVDLRNALRENSDDAIKKALKGQSLDDYVKQASREMDNIHANNKGRLSGMVDDYIGTPVASRLDTALKALSIIGYGTTAADAYLKAKEGEKAKEVAKALASAWAADIAGSVAGKVAASAAKSLGAGAVTSGVAGFVSGVGAGIVAGVIVHGTIEWTEEGINNMLGGYKVDDTVQKIFLDPAKIEEFLKMNPQEMKKRIDGEWSIEREWGGAYAGKGGGEHQQEKIKQQVLDKALETRNLLAQQAVRAQIAGEIIANEYKELVDKYEKGMLSDEELENAGLKLTKDVDKFVADKLAKDPRYRTYNNILEEMEKSGARPGLVDWAFGGKSKEDLTKIRQEADKGLEELRQEKQLLQNAIQYFDKEMQELKDAYSQRKSPEEIAQILEKLKDVKGDIADLMEQIQRDAGEVLEDINETYGKDEDLTAFNDMKAEIGQILTDFSAEVKDRLAQYKNVDDFSQDLKDAAQKNTEEDKRKEAEEKGKKKEEAKAKEDQKGQAPRFVGEIQTQKKDQDKDKTEEGEGEEGKGEEDKEVKDEPKFVGEIGETTEGKETGETPAETEEELQIIRIKADTVAAPYKKKTYQRIKNVVSISVVVKEKRLKRTLIGQEALSLLLNHGYCYHLAGVGFVTTSKFNEVGKTPEEEKPPQQPVPPVDKGRKPPAPKPPEVRKPVRPVLPKQADTASNPEDLYGDVNVQDAQR